MFYAPRYWLATTFNCMQLTAQVPNKSRCARRQNNNPIAALNKMKKLCCTNPKAAICPSFSGNNTTQNVIAAARIGVGTAAAKKITGKSGNKPSTLASTPNKFSAVAYTNTAANNAGDLSKKKAQ